MGQYGFYWEHAETGGARLLRAFGTTPEVVIPERIAGLSVTEIGAYCFAGTDRLRGQNSGRGQYEVINVPDGGQAGEGKAAERPAAAGTPGGGGPGEENAAKVQSRALREQTISPDAAATGALRELCGGYIESLALPDTVKRIGNLMCYQCTSLLRLECGPGLTEVGGDAFMNCGKLREIRLRCDSGEKTGLRQMLAQLSGEITAVFLGKGGAGRAAKLLFTEYYESYDEIAPAHLFGRNIEGEGFRARQCFTEGKPDFGQYDRTFIRACDGETERTLCRLAMNRLLYPAGLSEQAKRMYETYVSDHADCVCAQAVDVKDMQPVRYLCENRLIQAAVLDAALARAAKAGWAEGTAQLLNLKRTHFTGGARRYEFEDF